MTTTNAKIYCKISKVDPELRIVEGYASTEALDSQGEIVSREAIAGALKDYMKYANVREMHQPSAVGKTKSAHLDDKGLFISVKVVDDVAWKKVREEVYNGFSIGGTATAKNGNRIDQLRLSEISLVDRPACPEAVFTLWKSDGAPMSTNTKPAAKALTKGDIQAGHQLLAEALLAKSCGLYSIANLASVLEQLAWVTSDTEWEKQYEGDDSKVPEMLRAGFALLSDALKTLAAEETDETKNELETQAAANAAAAAAADEAAAAVTVTVELADKAGLKKDDGAAPPAAPAAAPVDQSTLTDAEKAALKVVMELLQKAGLLPKDEAAPAADAPADKPAEEPAKAEGEADPEKPKEEPAKDPAEEPKEEDKEKLAKADLAKAEATQIQKLNGEVETLRKRVKELEDQPAATKGVLRVVERDGKVSKVLTVQDAMREGQTDAKSALEKMFSGELGQEPIMPVMKL